MTQDNSQTEGATSESREIIPLHHYVESASATTSPDNAKSGPFAYILTACVLGGLIVLSLVLARVASSAVADEVASHATDSSAVGSGDLEQIIEQLMGNGDGNSGSAGSGATGGSATGHGSNLSRKDALDLDLSLYDTTVDDEVSATAYANVPDDVRGYVRSLLKADSGAATTLAQALNTAAREGDNPDMQAVSDAAAAGKAAIEATNAPTFADSSVNDALAKARQATLDRWDAIAAEVKLIDTDGQISYSDLEKADQAVEDKTDEAGDDFTAALQAAATK